ncbi:group II intron reverse transcriptase/maturase [Cyanobacterium aponinum UTEX 3222]|uniref:group II intron reverse transcriptase/maturase n=1 Tax=Cyanobacterium aponinum TaxID=379064 RepID=UPI00308D6E4D|nr:group II intron reverse transcriptase/maturase [Cyanobacterium aponinum UTEX 3222]
MNSQKYGWNNWNEIDWRTVEIAVFKLQKRIYKASQRGDTKSVHRLQRLLTNSYFGRLWATRRVTQDNQGKKTAGVDGIKSLKPNQRFELSENLRLNGKSKPTRRVWIPKPNGEQRPLGIPTMKERAKQALMKIALEPQWESKFEENSYGFRPAMSCQDAIEAIFKSIRQKPKYVLDTDIAKCFDKIDHNKLLAKLETYPTLRKQVKAWLKSGVIDKSWSPTEEGTPQGGVISPLLANIALHGMELEIKKFMESVDGRKTFGRRVSKQEKRNSISLIRYADDFVILHHDLNLILKCKEVIEEWLNEIGLELKPSKTRISHTLYEYNGQKGFDFLGFNIRQHKVGKNQGGKTGRKNSRKLGFTTIIKPTKEKIKAHIQKVKETINKHKSSPQIALIKELNPIIRGWSNYYSAVSSSEIFSYCDHVLYLQLKRWAERRHPNKSKKWVVNKYWHTKGNRNWVFAMIKEEGMGMELALHADTKIKYHTKVEKGRSIFDGDFIYWSTRMGKHPEIPTSKAKLLKLQKGKCKYCGLNFKDGDMLEIDHIIPKSKGGKDIYKNLQLLHKHCHNDKTSKDGSLNCTHDKGFIEEERNEVKVSRSVLKTSGSGDTSA